MIGKIISHYKIIEKLGAGGMGVVYKAQDLKLDRFVALKFLSPHLSADEDEKKRFIHEAKAASALDHPNICTIYEIDETEDGQMFIAMAYYEGETLKKKVSSEQLSVNDVIDSAMQVAQGLARAHEAGITHRDIKPANIMITNRGEVKIVDFGLAKLVGHTKLTKTGSTMVTAAYMSPEQARGEPVDHRTDIWSFGVVLYEMLTGRLPFRGEYEAAIAYSILHEQPEAATTLRTEVPMEMERIVNRALAKNPDERYQRVAELIEDLRHVKKELASKLAQVETTEPVQQYRKLAAIMFTDMVGYSALAQKNEPLALALLQEHRQILRPLFPKHGGREVETAGDAFFVEFGSALQAAQCAIAIQKALFERNASASAEKQIKLRIGLHLGDVVIVGKNVHGDGVNIAARIEPLAEPGGICISEDVARQIQNKIEVPVQKLGKAELKNIQLPVDIYRILLPWEKKQLSLADRASSILGRRSTQLVLIAVLAVIIGVIGFYMFARLPRENVSEEQATPQLAQLLRLTSHPGLEDEPSWSPDNRSLAYTSDEGGYLSIWIRQVDGERAIRIGKEGVDEAQPAWSPDGRYIAFVSSRNRGGRLGIFLGSRPIESHVYGQNGDLFMMPAFGGTARKLADDAYDPSWSPNGHKLAFRSIRDGSWRIYTLSLDDWKIEPVKGVEPRVIGLSWSPDGKWIAYIAGASAATGWDLYAVPATSGTPVQLTHDKADITLRPTWSRDSRWIIFSSNRGGELNLWRVRFESDPPRAVGPPQRLTTGIGEDVNPSASPDGSSYAYATLHTAPDIWQLEVSTRTLSQLTSETTIEDYPRLAADGNRLLFYSDRTGRLELWMMDRKTKEKTQLSRGGGAQNAWSPNGRMVAYDTPHGLQILDLISGKQMTVGAHLSAAYPAVSPDGKEVCFQGRDAHQYRLYRAPSTGGEVSIVPTPEGEPGNPSWSKDGGTIFYQLDQFGYRNIWAVDVKTGESRQISTGNTDDAHPDVSPDGRRLMFLRNHRDLYVLPTAGGEPELAYAFKEHNRLIEFPAWTHDGRGMIFSIADKSGDIFLLKTPNQKAIP